MGGFAADSLVLCIAETKTVDIIKGDKTRLTDTKDAKMTTLYHGRKASTVARLGNAAHIGICLVDETDTAESYAGHRGTVYATEIDLDALTVERCGGYDHDTDDCPADRESFRAAAAARGVDVLTYTDEDEGGYRHECYRIVSDRALQMVHLCEMVEE